MILNKIHENIKNIILWEYIVFSQDDRNFLFYNLFYPLNWNLIIIIKIF